MESDESQHASSDNESDSGSEVSVEGRRKYVGGPQDSPEHNSPKSPDSENSLSSSSSNNRLSDNELVVREKPSTPSLNDEDGDSVHEDFSSLDGDNDNDDKLDSFSDRQENKIDENPSGKLQRYNDDNASDLSASSNDLLNERDVNEDSSDDEREPSPKPTKPIATEKSIPVDLKHEDLSDVSDLEDMEGDNSDNDMKDDEDNNCQNNNSAESNKKRLTKNPTENEDGEEQLDFEAEDGECADAEVPKHPEITLKSKEGAGAAKEAKKPEPEELEEGELTDEDDVRPEETEPRPVCRFFSRGQCTWGASCRFLHPGVTDKGNYTMFELIRPVVPGDYGNERPPYGGGRPHFEQPMVESAWERGLRTAKEMMKKSLKRKEQDIDFEEKKMNLSLTQEELDKENGYYARAPSPEARYMVRHPAPVDYPPPPARAPASDEYYVRRPILYETDYVPSRERMRPYREVPQRRPPEYYVNKHEEEPPLVGKAIRKPKREVIVQRVEERPVRGDEWQDPWMRSKSPGARKAARRQSYSSGSSYSSSSSSRSSSGSSRSSYKSRSRSPKMKRTQSSHKRQVSPSVIVSERKAANERAALMNPPAPRKKAPSPGMMRVGAQNPPAPSKLEQLSRRGKFNVAAALARVKRNRPSRSSSGSSSGSSSSESDSSGSSSSSSRDRSATPRRPTGVDLAMALKAKAIDALKTGAEKRQIKLTLKNVASKKAELTEMAKKTDTSQSRKRVATSPPVIDPKGAPPTRKASTRREELLKQLKAVEDAIAKKRSKVN